MDCFINIDKPAGLTSHDIVNRVRKHTGHKAGHTGTLDPFATGVLPVAIGEATKAIPFLDESVKEYEATVVFGKATDTYDCTGATVSEGPWQDIDPDSLEKLILSLVGNQKQMPPMFSALKHQGTPLYKLARKGVTIEREARDIEIHSVTIENISLPHVTFTVKCSRGTYIRSLANDLGINAGCGAHLSRLKRLGSGSFTIKDAISLEALTQLADRKALDEVGISPLEALAHLKEVKLTERGAAAVRNGIIPADDDLLFSSTDEVNPGDKLRLSFNGRLAAVAENISAVDGKISKFMKFLRVFN